MHIENATINLFVAPTMGFDFFAKAAAKSTAILKPPRIAEVWAGQGGFYLGVARGLEGAPDYHLIMSPDEPTSDAAWQPSMDWAKGVKTDGHEDFEAWSRFESALAYANAKHLVNASHWYWTSTQYSDSFAFVQHFINGTQFSDSKKAEGRVRAVRRLPL